MNNFTIEQTSAAVLTVRFEDICAGWEQWLLLGSDRHHDNVFCDRDLERKHLDEAIKRKAFILDFGDLFCAMQGKWDPRSDMESLRPEDKGVDYLDRIVDHAAEDYAKYAPNWLLLAMGNHESNVLNRHGTNLTSNLAHEMSKHGGHPHIGGFGGWVRFQFVTHKTKQFTIRLKYHHGTGGTNAPVTRGVIHTNRQAVYLPDADLVVNGHNHEAYVVPIARERMTTDGNLYRDLVWFVRTPGYKDAYADGMRGWEVERGMAPTPRGCIWVRFSKEEGLNTHRIKMDVMPELV